MKLFGKVFNRSDSVFSKLFYRGRSNNTRNDRTIFNALRANGKASVPIRAKSWAKKIAENHLFRHNDKSKKVSRLRFRDIDRIAIKN